MEAVKFDLLARRKDRHKLYLHIRILIYILNILIQKIDSVKAIHIDSLYALSNKLKQKQNKKTPFI